MAAQGLPRAVIEIGFILFLFYANLLMGEYVRSADPHKTFLFGRPRRGYGEEFRASALPVPVLGYLVFERLRKLP